jgi:phosphoglycolate phosphatase
MIQMIDITKESGALKVLQLQHQSYRIEAKLIEFDELPPLRDTLADLQQSGETFYGFYEQNDLYGVISFKYNHGIFDIHRLMVHPDHFKRGIAKKLLHNLEMQGKNGESLVVSTGSKNTPAIDFYIKCGFEVNGEKEIIQGLWLTSFKKELIKPGGITMDSIIFDLDGTLWDSRKTVVHAWNEVIKNHDKVNEELTSQQLKETMGLQMHEIGRILFPQLNEEEREQFMNACSEIETRYLTERGGTLYNRMEEVLEALAKKYKLFIVSNCQHGYIEAFYDFHRLDNYFVDYENPGRTGLSKGENIKLVMERNHLKQPVYVGDTEGDREAAQYADIPFVYAKYGFGEVKNYDYMIESFGELLELF